MFSQRETDKISLQQTHIIRWGAVKKWFSNITLHVDVLMSWFFFAHLTTAQMPLLQVWMFCTFVYVHVCVWREEAGGRWGIAGRIAAQVIVSEVCVSASWLNRVYQAGAMAIVVQHYCGSVSHSALNNGIFPPCFAKAVAGANLNLIHPPDSPRMQKPFLAWFCLAPLGKLISKSIMFSEQARLI